MRIVAIANGQFAVPSLRAIKNSNHEIAGVIVMPVRNQSRGKKAVPQPVREMLKNDLVGIPFYEPEDINSNEGVELLKKLKPDLIFICDYGRILSREIIGLATLGGINLHGSLLPKYRGAAPINRAIQNGETELGVSVILIEPKVDAGPIIATTSYFPEQSETAIDVEELLSNMGADLVVTSIDQISKGLVKPIPQSLMEASAAPKLKKEEGHIDWSKSSLEIINLYRAFQPWPRTFSDWIPQRSPDSRLRLILGPFIPCHEGGMVTEGMNQRFIPGYVLKVTKQELLIKTGDGALQILKVQPSGKKTLSVQEFLRGYDIQPGDLLQ